MAGKKRELQHGKSKAKIYKIWTSMIQRCMNTNSAMYKNYGARGITVSEAWLTFENFYADMGDRPDGRTLDRENNNSGYSKENCRWATHKEQSANKRDRLMNKNNSTGVEGVYWKKSHNKYVARKTVNGKRTYIGFYKTIDEAKAAIESYQTPAFAAATYAAASFVSY